ncbi:hypothetical protein CYMTET_32991 [Cymbomonas tetramitiformis]|uniref:Uncharacterized protein n=1 Tax=Cymbomonas tetramitiformis TaxID=36881 RepID=A0AAE0KRB1_9CHLO|nr:hypothetical protein CYMTET_32991 [Cymbomonas tetramitiformis]
MNPLLSKDSSDRPLSSVSANCAVRELLDDLKAGRPPSPRGAERQLKDTCQRQDMRQTYTGTGVTRTPIVRKSSVGQDTQGAFNDPPFNVYDGQVVPDDFFADGDEDCNGVNLPPPLSDGV